jgi:hypothetical protein
LPCSSPPSRNSCRSRSATCGQPPPTRAWSCARARRGTTRPSARPSSPACSLWKKRTGKWAVEGPGRKYGGSYADELEAARAYKRALDSAEEAEPRAAQPQREPAQPPEQYEQLARETSPYGIESAIDPATGARLQLRTPEQLGRRNRGQRTSIFSGVCWDAHKGMWHVFVGSKYRGQHRDELVAARIAAHARQQDAEREGP